MRLDRLVPLPTPVQPPGRQGERPPRREPDAPERHEAAEPPPAKGGDGDQPPTSPDHIDIKV